MRRWDGAEEEGEIFRDVLGHGSHALLTGFAFGSHGMSVPEGRVTGIPPKEERQDGFVALLIANKSCESPVRGDTLEDTAN